MAGSKEKGVEMPGMWRYVRNAQNRGSNIGFFNPASRRNFSFHPATMKIFIPIPPYQTHVALAHR